MIRFNSPFWTFVISLMIINFSLAFQIGTKAPESELLESGENTHSLSQYQSQETEGCLSLDEPTFEFVMHDQIIEYVNLTQDSSHWPIPFDFHGVVSNITDTTINLAFIMNPVTPDTNVERRQYSLCYLDACRPPTHGYQSHTGTYPPGVVDTTLDYTFYWQITGDNGLPTVADLVGDYLLDVSIFDTSNPEEVITYRLELRDITDESVTIHSIPLVNNHRLLSNYPNPFNPSTTIEFVVDQTGPVTLNIIDILGRNVAELVNSSLTNGAYSATWDAKNSSGVPMPSGSYWVRLNTPDQTAMHRIILIR